MKRLSNLFHALSLVVALSFSGASHANIDALSNNMFANVLTNYTPAGVYETQSMGIIAGPSYYARSKNSTIQLMNLSLPRIKAGCNGIDLWGGSFSFISGEQLVNFLRSVAAQAVPFAFKLALDAICPSCEKHMQKLQDIANFINQQNFQSCDQAKKLFDMAGLTPGGDASNAIKSAMEPVSNALNTTLGAATDWLDSFRSPTKTPAKRQSESFPATVNEIQGNIAWKVLTNSGLSNWWGTVYAGADDVSLKQIMMSYTGTIVKFVGSGIDLNNTVEAGADLDVRSIPATISSMDEFLDGGSVTVLQCDTTDADGCLFPTPTRVTIRGFRSIVRATVMGILPKISQVGGSTLTNAEKSFLENAPGSIGTQLVRLSTNPAAATAYAELISDYVGAELAAQLVNELILAFEIASVGEKKDPSVHALVTNLSQKRKQYLMEFQVQMARLGSAEKSMNVANHIRASLTARSGGSILSGR